MDYPPAMPEMPIEAPVTPQDATNPSTSPSAWDHVSLVLAALTAMILAIFDSYHALSPMEWSVIGLGLAALGVKGITGSLPRS